MDKKDIDSWVSSVEKNAINMTKEIQTIFIQVHESAAARIEEEIKELVVHGDLQTKYFDLAINNLNRASVSIQDSVNARVAALKTLLSKTRGSAPEPAMDSKIDFKVDRYGKTIEPKENFIEFTTENKDGQP